MRWQPYSLKLFFRKKIITTAHSIALALNLGSALWLLIAIPRRGEQIFLHSTAIFGVDSVGSYKEMWLVPLIGLLLFLLNLVLSWFVIKEDSYLAHVIAIANVIIQIIIVVAVGILVALNA